MYTYTTSMGTLMEEDQILPTPEHRKEMFIFRSLHLGHVVDMIGPEEDGLQSPVDFTVITCKIAFGSP